MQITTEELPNRQLCIRVQVEEDEVGRALRQAASRLSHRRAIPGFRKGKAPYQVVLSRFGKGALYEEALDELGPQLYQEAIKEQAIEPYGGADMEVEQLEPLIVKFVVPLQPSVQLGAYRQIRAQPSTPNVSEEEVNSFLQMLLESQATWIPVERPAALNDRVTLQLSGTMDGKTILSEENLKIVLDGESSPVMPGFSQKVVGMGKGDQASWTLTYPHDFPNRNLAGKPVDFQVLLKEVEEKRLPELTDELASKISELGTAEALVAKIRGDLQERAQLEAEKAFRETLLDQLVGGAQIQYPPAALESKLRRLRASFEARLQGQGLSLEQYLNIMDLTEAQLEEDLRAQAKKELEADLALEELARVENIAVEPQEVELEIQRLFSQSEEAQRQRFPEDTLKAVVSKDLLRRRALERLIAIAKGEGETKPSPKRRKAAASSKAPSRQKGS